jgi:hypothetical protein
MAQLDTEFLHQIKLKVEFLLKTLIMEYRMEELILASSRYGVDFNVAMNSKYYKLYADQRNAKGQQYNYGHDYVPEGFQQWLWLNFPDFMHTEEIYDMLCHGAMVTQNDLRLLNSIFRKHLPKTA